MTRLAAGREARPGRIRVCMVIQGFRPKIGGAELQLERLLPHLAERDVVLTVLTRAYPGAPRRETVGGAAIFRTRVAGDSPRASLTFVLGCLAHLVRRRRSLDVIHAHGALSEGAIALAARALGFPVLVKVLRAGDQGDFDVLSRRPGGRLRERLLARSVSFVALSGEAREELRSRGVPAERIFEIPNGVDTAVFRPADAEERAALRDRLELPPGPLAVFVGRLIEVKEVATLVRALPDVPSLALVVLGDGPERLALEQLARELGVSARITFAGASRNVAEHLRAADIFVLPSRSEGMSNALLEAMASGLACVATPVSGTSELLAEERGLLAPVGDVAAWSDALSTLIADQTLSRRYGERARRHVEEQLSLEATADRLVAAYRQVAG